MPRGRAARAARLIQDSPREAAIPDKLYYRIGEVSELTQTKAYVLRYWETEFPTLRPVKSKSGHRLYRRKDVETYLRDPPAPVREGIHHRRGAQTSGKQ